MFSNKENVNILTSLLIRHGIRHAVVCPGSRNAPIVHNLNECEEIHCHAVTDERSAGFYALGLALAVEKPVAVCVTSGSAVLNVMPAVAEAYYQRVPMVVISADRPMAWIDQQDGQTLPQTGVLNRFVCKSVSLPEPHDDTERWYCNRLVNEALLAMTQRGGGPVHINVPITEPLFCFDTEELPEERTVRLLKSATDTATIAQNDLFGLFRSERPMIVVGQMSADESRYLPLEELRPYFAILSEPLSRTLETAYLDDVIASLGDETGLYEPDTILYIGGTLVSKRLKQFLRGCQRARSWVVNEAGEITDTFMNAVGVVQGSGAAVLTNISGCVSMGQWLDDDYDTEDICWKSQGTDFAALWNDKLKATARKTAEETPRETEAATVKEFENQLSRLDKNDFFVHYANSTAVRLGCRYASHHIFCNRGVNGIEGSLSTAAGFSLSGMDTYCVIGDLSFFYDQNALWNTSLAGNLRILLINNSGGGIFYGLKGLSDSPACDKYIAGEHHTTAEGICRQHGVEYLSADGDNMKEMISRFIGYKGKRPILLELTI